MHELVRERPIEAGEEEDDDGRAREGIAPPRDDDNLEAHILSVHRLQGAAYGRATLREQR